MTKGNKKGHAGLIIFILILVLVIGGGTGFYFYQRQQPRKAVENFLDSMKKMDFNTMESMIQSDDLTALDNADIRDAAYTDFFSEINKKMTYKITRNRFDIQNGTASVTAHITYIDGTNIYKATITEFLRQIVSNAYAGNQLTEEETQAKLASILNEQAKKVEKDVFSETDITYPVIKTDSGWKIVSLDDETVKIMSANFKSVEEEINNSLNNMDNEDSSGSSSNAPEASADDTLNLTTEKFTIKYTKHTITKDFAGNPCIMVYYDYTNNSSSASSAMVDVSLKAYQHGESCEAAIPENNDDAIDHFTAEIQPGQTVNVCQAFTLTDESDVTIQAQILDLMNQLKKETGTSILFITHDLGVVAEVCDDVAVMYCGRVVERGDVKTIFANPSHPYTKGLLGSIPRLGDAGKELKSIPGNVPNPKYMPKGCKFEPRCPYASEKCREEEPGFFQIEEGHISRCWLCESGQLKTDHVEKAGD